MKHRVVTVLGMVLAVALGAFVASADEAKEPAGKTLFLTYKCNSCHTIDAVGVAKRSATEEKEETAATPASTTPKKKPPDLSSVGLDVKADWITKYLKKLETNKAGKKHIKLFKGTDEELATLVTWLGTMKAEKKAADKAEKAETKAEEAEKSEETEKAEKSEGAETK